MLADWVIQAAQLPVAFAQVREDPRLDLEVLAELGPRPRVIMIASGGETALCLARRPLSRLLLVDVNPAQLELVQRKWKLASEPYPPEPEQLDALNHGRYERVFAQLDSDQLEQSFARVMSQENLMALFGAGATRNPRQPFHDHFSQRTRLALARPDAAHNPFLWQVLHSKFPPGVSWDWLQPKQWKEPLLTPEYFQGEMVSALSTQADSSFEFVHLSNILDWLSPEEAEILLQQAARVLQPGGLVLIRQLNSSLDIPALNSPFQWDPDRGADMVERDRSFFYPFIHLGRR